MDLEKNLLEFYGILIGDGCISKYIYNSKVNYELRIDGSSITDVDYYNQHLINLIFNLINKKPKVHFRRTFNGIYLHFRSKEFALFLKKTFNFPFGKKANIKIENKVLNDFNKLKHVLKGLFDTDGCLYFTKNNSESRYYPIIEISSHSFNLIKQLQEALISQGFTVRISHYKDSVKLHGKKNLLKWMELIGTNHPDKDSKFKFWTKYGYCPKISELTYRKRLDVLGP